MSDSAKCGKCGLPIEAGENGLRHFGRFTAHAEERCLVLLRQELERAVARAGAWERTATRWEATANEHAKGAREAEAELDALRRAIIEAVDGQPCPTSAEWREIQAMIAMHRRASRRAGGAR